MENGDKSRLRVSLIAGLKYGLNGGLDYRMDSGPIPGYHSKCFHIRGFTNKSCTPDNFFLNALLVLPTGKHTYGHTLTCNDAIGNQKKELIAGGLWTFYPNLGRY